MVVFDTTNKLLALYTFSLFKLVKDETLEGGPEGIGLDTLRG